MVNKTLKNLWFIPIAMMALMGDASADIARPWQLGMQEPASPVMEFVNEFHNFLLIIITLITLFVLG
ncbi:MAG: cytochrome c oxidase subunit II transmembrane domain-containing protein, partial [Rhodospirillales bacterium]